MIQWETVKDDFRWDGSLRDIYITPATLDDWRAIYPMLCEYANVKFSVDGIGQQPPTTVEETFAHWPKGHPMLRIRVGRINVVFHFFTAEEIECDVNPREIASQIDLNALLDFVQQLGDKTHKQVVITPENVRHEAFLSYAPESKRFEYHAMTA